MILQCLNVPGRLHFRVVCSVRCVTVTVLWSVVDEGAIVSGLLLVFRSAINGKPDTESLRILIFFFGSVKN